MIGNDIVDLNFASFNSEERRDRYALKILHPNEQEFYQVSSEKSVLIWRYWSIKEAVYKAFAQQNLAAVFSPSKIEVTIRSSKNATAHIAGNHFHCTSIMSETLVYTVAVARSAVYLSSYFMMKGTQHSGDHTRLKQAAAQLLNLETNRLFIAKRNGKIPRLYDRKSQKSWPMSITHHGNFMGYALRF
ncbi:MAG: 4'-phosphopantetheinyl transferase superfamily protein [Gilvibacter sp.]